MINLIKRIVKYMTMSDIDRYLSQSTDMVDLERRQKHLQHKGYRI